MDVANINNNTNDVRIIKRQHNNVNACNFADTDYNDITTDANHGAILIATLIGNNNTYTHEHDNVDNNVINSFDTRLNNGSYNNNNHDKYERDNTDNNNNASQNDTNKSFVERYILSFISMCIIRYLA